MNFQVNTSLPSRTRVLCNRSQTLSVRLETFSIAEAPLRWPNPKSHSELVPTEFCKTSKAFDPHLTASHKPGTSAARSRQPTDTCRRRLVHHARVYFATARPPRRSFLRRTVVQPAHPSNLSLETPNTTSRTILGQNKLSHKIINTNSGSVTLSRN